MWTDIEILVFHKPQSFSLPLISLKCSYTIFAESQNAEREVLNNPTEEQHERSIVNWQHCQCLVHYYSYCIEMYSHHCNQLNCHQRTFIAILILIIETTRRNTRKEEWRFSVIVTYKHRLTCKFTQWDAWCHALGLFWVTPSNLSHFCHHHSRVHWVHSYLSRSDYIKHAKLMKHAYTVVIYQSR